MISARRRAVPVADRKHLFNPGHQSSSELARATLEQQPPRPSEVADDPRRARALRGDLDNIVAKALKKDPAERYATAAALAQDLEKFLASKPVSARPDSLAYRAERFIRRHRAGVATGAIMLLLLIGATVAITMQMLEARRQRDAALYESRRAEFQANFAYHIMSEVGRRRAATGSTTRSVSSASARRIRTSTSR